MFENVSAVSCSDVRRRECQGVGVLGTLWGGGVARGGLVDGRRHRDGIGCGELFHCKEEMPAMFCDERSGDL